MSTSQTVTPPNPLSGSKSTNPSDYGRARLKLGMTTVGFFVTLSTTALILGWAQRWFPTTGELSGEVALLIRFVLLYALLHVPFDLLGGYLLPSRHRREHLPLTQYLIALVRGVLGHTVVLLCSGSALLLGGHFGGLAGAIGGGAASVLLLLLLRPALARLYAPLGVGPIQADPHSSRDIRSTDEGFTGGFTGVLSPRVSWFPSHWRSTLGSEGVRLAAARRSIIAQSQSWRRGRMLAIVFTVVGVAASAWIVDSAGPARLGTAAGTVELGLYFTLYSFLGLLLLPTYSRRGVAEIDVELRGQIAADTELEEAMRRLDALQDAEPRRAPLVEAIFHPIPSVENRLQAGGAIPTGYWDAARTAVFLSASGLGLLGRAVHCNCGRPALWAFLPTE